MVKYYCISILIYWSCFGFAQTNNELIVNGGQNEFSIDSLEVSELNQKTNIPFYTYGKFSTANIKTKFRQWSASQPIRSVRCLGDNKRLTFIDFYYKRVFPYEILFLNQNEDIIKPRYNQVLNKPVSKVSLDVKGQFYPYLKNALEHSTTPPKQSIRIEEMINAFEYDYSSPKQGVVGVDSELSVCPWNPKHQLLQVKVQSKSIKNRNQKPCHLVFLVDISWSMNSYQEIGLIKTTLREVSRQLKPNDKISILTFSDHTKVLLRSVHGNDFERIDSTINSIKPSGFTGGGGIEKAYQIAEEYKILNGINTVILATDDGFNHGMQSNKSLKELIENQAMQGIEFTMLGYGCQKYKPISFKTLTQLGNGKFAFVDSEEDIDNVVKNGFRVEQYLLAEQVKTEVKFNPNQVQSYRLIGYKHQNPLEDNSYRGFLREEGWLTTDQQATLLYELIPNENQVNSLMGTDPMFQVNMSYRHASSGQNHKVEFPFQKAEVNLKEASKDFQFASAVAMFGLVLENSNYLKKWKIKDLIQLAKNSTNQNPNREEFLRLIDLYQERKYTQRLPPVKNESALELINPDQTGFKLTQDDLKNYTSRDLIQIINQRR